MLEFVILTLRNSGRMAFASCPFAMTLRLCGQVSSFGCGFFCRVWEARVCLRSRSWRRSAETPLRDVPVGSGFRRTSGSGSGKGQERAFLGKMGRF